MVGTFGARSSTSISSSGRTVRPLSCGCLCMMKPWMTAWMRLAISSSSWWTRVLSMRRSSGWPSSFMSTARVFRSHAVEFDDDILVPTEAHHQLDRHARAEAARPRKDLPRRDPLEQRRFALRLHPDHDNLWQRQIHGAPQLQHDVQNPPIGASLVVEHARDASAAASARRFGRLAWWMVVGSSVGCGFSHRPR
eukprot:scaffold2363_cov159-Pinguiococcus_pyrenoidosus.AAC.5